jgi:GTP-binding protein HflX
LAATAGAITVGKVIQNREAIHQKTYIGKGKIEEVAELIRETNATGVICDDELSPSQMHNLELELDIKVMDRTLIILDIFANRATTAEGKIQVELAQLKYRLARLVGLRSSLSRLGGGIGTRGPGEKKLEMDRRLVKSRIAQLNNELSDVKRHREVMRKQRMDSTQPVIAIVGYTNAGKSTLLNALTGADVLEEDKLFATLDPTTRVLELENKEQVLITDTVGFIRKLPHHLIEAFKSTLEEAKYADIIFHVVDASNPQMESQMETVYKTLEDLEVGNKPVYTLFNKIDKVQEMELSIELKDPQAKSVLGISARNGVGFEEIKELIREYLHSRQMYVERVVPYAETSVIQLVRKYGSLLEEEYRAEGIFIRGYVPKEYYSHVSGMK